MPYHLTAQGSDEGYSALVKVGTPSFVLINFTDDKVQIGEPGWVKLHANAPKSRYAERSAVVVANRGSLALEISLPHHPTRYQAQTVPPGFMLVVPLLGKGVDTVVEVDRGWHLYGKERMLQFTVEPPAFPFS